VVQTSQNGTSTPQSPRTVAGEQPPRPHPLRQPLFRPSLAHTFSLETIALDDKPRNLLSALTSRHHLIIGLAVTLNPADPVFVVWPSTVEDREAENSRIPFRDPRVDPEQSLLNR